MELPTYFETRFKVVSIHFTSECNLHCPFCYRPKNSGNEKPREFFLELVPYIKKLAPQIALGGGEPLIDPRFLIEMGKRCKLEGVILNFTTNGKLFLEMSDNEIYEVLKDMTMVSISFDYFKWGDNTETYVKVIHRIKHIMGYNQENLEGTATPVIGANLLLDRGMVANKGIPFLNVVRWLFLSAQVAQVLKDDEKLWFELGDDFYKWNPISYKTCALFDKRKDIYNSYAECVRRIGL